MRPLRLLFPFLAGWLCVFAHVSGAQATVGGERTVTLEGYDPVERAVVFLEHDGSEGLEPPRQYWLPLGGTRPRTPRIMRWQHPSPQHLVDGAGWLDDDPHFSAFRSRALPLIHLPIGEARLSVAPRCRRRVIDGRTVFGRCDLTVTIEGRHLVRRIVRLVSLRSPRVELVSLSLVPGTRQAVAVLRHVGVLVEGGYERDEVVLLRYVPPRSTTAIARSAELRLEMVSGTALRLASLEGGVRRAVRFAPDADASGCAPDDDIALSATLPAGEVLSTLGCAAGSRRYDVVRRGRIVSVFRTTSAGTLEVARLHVATRDVELGLWRVRDENVGQYEDVR